MSIEAVLMIGLVGAFCVLVTLGLAAKLRTRRMMETRKSAAPTPEERAVPLTWMQSVY